MKKILLAISLLCFLSTSIFAQSERVDVVLHLKDGSTVEKAMEYNSRYPWSYQKSISVFDRELKEEKKIKRKQKKKYKAKELVGYESQGSYYETQKVMMAGRGDHSSTLKSLPTFTLLEKVVEGTITVYKGYGYPPSVASGISFDEIYEDLRSHPEYFIQKEGKSKGKLKMMEGVNIEKWIGDAPVVSEKFANGEYGNFKRKKKKKLGNFLKGQLENEKPSLIIKVIEEYNAEVAAE